MRHQPAAAQFLVCSVISVVLPCHGNAADKVLCRHQKHGHSLQTAALASTKARRRSQPVGSSQDRASEATAQLVRHAKRHNAPARALANMQVCILLHLSQAVQ